MKAFNQQETTSHVGELVESLDATQTRKADHLRICLGDTVQCREVTTGLERYRFTHCCLPELDYNDIRVQTTFLGKSLGAPLLISSMTGGNRTGSGD
ncbi:hypothetical protein [Neosynechococcus sphagnicola]|uniref:hypothetical protein n=1 Tax=Neosynechococcus sphagnicola TaxID=1501145 RepID=UPI000AC1487A